MKPDELTDYFSSGELLEIIYFIQLKVHKTAIHCITLLPKLLALKCAKLSKLESVSRVSFEGISEQLKKERNGRRAMRTGGRNMRNKN